MKHQTLFIVLMILSVFSCQKKETLAETTSEVNSYRVQLKENQAENVLNQKFGISMRAGWLDFVPSFLTDIPKADTLSIRFTSFLHQRKLNKLYKDGLLDSMEYPSNRIKKGVYVINGYRDNKQFVIIDANNNFSFKDDTVFNYDINFKHRLPKNVNLRDSISYITVTYDDFDGKGISKKKLKVKPLPKKISYHEFLTEDQLKKINKKQLNDIFDVRLFYQQDWEGVLALENRKYVIHVLEGLIGPRVSFYEGDPTTIVYNSDHRKYRIKDTLKLNGQFYRIDSITMVKDELFIRKLDIQAPQWGFLKGEKSVDFKFQNILEKERKMSDLLQDKEYVLVDFWGTWCAPCKALTPDLQQIHKNYGDFLNIVSLAYDKEKEPVLDYINKNNMDWEHIFLQGNAKNGKEKKPKLIKNFAIEAYPTFILIDKNLRIISRGVGKKGLQKVLEICTAVRANKEYQKKKANN
ncbi:TlpA disulfide reductase family protein [Aquimarina sp. MMG016]|uniref:TlpA family protein disulfide reductase n=1 Tax=Aquimarina sp. MMG016 TaxID=2822690 RepID=UPI001B3A7A89|nr:TlpA disulfide reductase family protein [Aquimarina sp. MMG016]MBQ4820013.1 TlpA family protein disulfide reductase [Aquimarina sp. MMG016]